MKATRVACSCGLLVLPWLWADASQAERLSGAVITPVSYSLEYFTVDQQGNALAAAGRTLYRIVSAGDSARAITNFSNSIQGIHVMASGAIVVSTDDDRWDPRKPCRIYLSRDGGASFRVIKTIPESSALWWSMTSDRNNNLYVGEYGPRGPNQSKSVWKTSDYGRTWKVVFRAPNLDGVHVHRVAVDPKTDFLWVTYGDRTSEGVYLSRNRGASWTWVRTAQPTSVVFAEDAIYWGEDTVAGVVTRYERATGRIDTVLQASRRGNYGGSVYDMAKGRTGLIYAPMVKYAEQTHHPSLWVGQGTSWELLMSLPVQPGKAGGFSQISPPDRDGYLYVRGYKIKDPGTPPPAGRVVAAAARAESPGLALAPNQPNPFNAWTTLSYVLPQPTRVRLSIYSAAGQRVRTLVDEIQDSGEHRVVWNGTDEGGQPVASGVYLCRLSIPQAQRSRTLLLLK